MKTINLFLTLFLLNTVGNSSVSSSHRKRHEAKDNIGCRSKIYFPITDSAISQYPFKMNVFGIPIFASTEWSEVKLNHVASVLAELLDQNEDGCPDDLYSFNNIINTTYEDTGCQGIALVLPDHDIEDVYNDSAELAEYIHKLFPYPSPCVYFGGGQDETRLECTGLNFTQTCEDYSIELLFDFVTYHGVIESYPSTFGMDWEEPSYLTEAMDIARGGRFKVVPNHYPSSAWFTLNMTKICDYYCQVVNYLWFGYCSYSGICEGRVGALEFEPEFKYLTRSELETGDVKLSKLFREARTHGYGLPFKPVDGKYHGCKKCFNGPNHGGDDLSNFLDLLELA